LNCPGHFSAAGWLLFIGIFHAFLLDERHAIASPARLSAQGAPTTVRQLHQWLHLLAVACASNSEISLT
jgi:hypothetical protein